MDVAPATRTADAAIRALSDPALTLHQVSVDYGRTRVLHGVDLAVSPGELIALLGPSGSGKTTVIRTVAGFIVPSEGVIRLHGSDLDGRAVYKRQIGMVFQSYALFPHMSVRDNIAFPLRIQRKSASQTRARVDELIDLVQLNGHADKRPSGLSGGQQQRVALARALAMDPELLLLDEPLSNLDANLRKQVGEEIRRLQLQTGTTTIMVTHDRQEAFGMADRIAVLQGGRIEQLDTPSAIYRRPSSLFMATFAGDGNLFPVTQANSTGGHTVVETSVGAFESIMQIEDPRTVLVRPEDVQIVERFAGIESRVRSTFYYGATLEVELEIGESTVHATTAGTRADQISAGDVVGIRVAPQDVILLPGEPS